MSKTVLSLAERLAQLRHIPQHMLPGTLKHKIVLPKLTEIKIQSNKSAKEIGPTFSFYRKYIADLRFHNPHLKIIKQITQTGPLITRISLKKSQQIQPLIIEGVKCKTAEDLKNKIVQYHNSQQ